MWLPDGVALLALGEIVCATWGCTLAEEAAIPRPKFREYLRFGGVFLDETAVNYPWATVCGAADFL